MDCTSVESYNINQEYFISSQSSFLIILDSNDSIAQDHILPLQEYYSLMRKINKKQGRVFDDVMYTKKNKNPRNQLIYSLQDEPALVKLLH